MIRKLLISLALATPAGAFELGFPLDCTLGDTCYIQQYIDHDAGAAVQDFTCGDLSYDGHDGTDFALPTRAEMAAGIEVLATADGTVKGVRDGIADFAPVITGKECGNGVVVDHGGGWESQYCHLKQGSISLHVGDHVAKGAPLGQVGQSGMAEFPHLHFALRFHGRNIDPFAPKASNSCGAQGQGLWQTPIPYTPAGLIGVGLSPEVPEFTEIKAGLESPDLPKTAPALVLWAYYYGVRAGDAILFDISGPEGRVIQERSLIEKPKALGFRAVGKRLKTAAWPAGRYTGTIHLMRGSTELGTQSLSITLAP